jgi:hypothetical protein
MLIFKSNRLATTSLKCVSLLFSMLYDFTNGFIWALVSGRWVAWLQCWMIWELSVHCTIGINFYTITQSLYWVESFENCLYITKPFQHFCIFTTQSPSWDPTMTIYNTTTTITWSKVPEDIFQFSKWLRNKIYEIFPIANLFHIGLLCQWQALWPYPEPHAFKSWSYWMVCCLHSYETESDMSHLLKMPNVCSLKGHNCQIYGPTYVDSLTSCLSQVERDHCQISN